MKLLAEQKEYLQSIESQILSITELKVVGHMIR